MHMVVTLFSGMGRMVAMLAFGMVVAFVGMIVVDFLFYWEHRASHEIRLLWATHVTHHSSERFNLSTALRQTWTGQTGFLFFIPAAAIGVPLPVIFLSFAINLLYQFWIHTEAIDRMWGWFEWLFNTPSHHRVHHGTQQQYLDRNYGGILIVWDRLFKTFEPEGERVVYGLTKNLDTHNLWKVATHEFVAIWRDVRGARSWGDRAGFVLRGPGWAPVSADAADQAQLAEQAA